MSYTPPPMNSNIIYPRTSAMLGFRAEDRAVYELIAAVRKAQTDKSGMCECCDTDRPPVVYLSPDDPKVVV